MSTRDIANENPLDPDDAWFMPALLVGVMLILIGSASCLETEGIPPRPSHRD